jgi:hypothetical protein
VGDGFQANFIRTALSLISGKVVIKGEILPVPHQIRRFFRVNDNAVGFSIRHLSVEQKQVPKQWIETRDCLRVRGLDLFTEKLGNLDSLAWLPFAHEAFCRLAVKWIHRLIGSSGKIKRFCSIGEEARDNVCIAFAVFLEPEKTASQSRRLLPSP